MSRFVALLRGINVGRAKRIAMADLRSLLEGLGHSDVRTLLNSGNAVFRAEGGRALNLASAIEQEIANRLGLSVPVVVVTASELSTIVKDNPLSQASSDPSKHLVAFVRQRETLAAARGLLSKPWDPEAFSIGSKAAYLWCANGIIESKVAQAFSRATGEAATTRNWATVLKLQTMVAADRKRV